jgi:hypothetical protein
MSAETRDRRINHHLYMIGSRYDEYQNICDLVVRSNGDVVLYMVVDVNVSMR